MECELYKRQPLVKCFVLYMNRINLATLQTSRTNLTSNPVKNTAMLFTILLYIVYCMVYTVLLAIAGLWCFEECALTEEEEYEFIHYHRAMPY
ncbi:unnamed protein product, partial [Brenthis ino]